MTEFEQAKLIAGKILDEPYCDPDRDEAIVARQFNRLIERTSWIPVTERVPTRHMQTCLIWVVKSHLIIEGEIPDEGYADVGSYNVKKSQWVASSEVLSDDAIVEISHWIPIEQPRSQVDETTVIRQ